MSTPRAPGRRVLSALLPVLLCLFVLGGCGDTHESVADDIIANMDKAAHALTGIKTEADLDAAVKQLDAIAVDMEALAAKWKKLGKPDEETSAAIQKKLEDKGSEWEKSMMDPPPYLMQHPEAGVKLQAPMEKIGEAFSNLQ